MQSIAVDIALTTTQTGKVTLLFPAHDGNYSRCDRALSRTSPILGTINPLAFGLAIIGFQLPDLDTTTSTVDWE
ncbi:MAG: hypothetical protein KME09_21120 [Pleurocapsa minor HA4230-MV1]|nr:hypothetical protein [Pleurocapsa minor HA4230-MV1]